MKEIDKIALLYIKDGQILSTLSKGKDTYYLPGGKRELNETDEQTLIRECKEELTIDVKEDTIKYYGTFKAQAHGKAEGIIVKMTCYIAEFIGKNQAKFRNSRNKMVNIISPVDKLIFKDLYEKGILK